MYFSEWQPEQYAMKLRAPRCKAGPLDPVDLSGIYSLSTLNDVLADLGKTTIAV